MTQRSDDDPLSTGGAFGVLAGLDRDASDPILGRKLGDYEILGLIAAGGMGRVYRARRADGSFEREVAVKVSAGSGVSRELLSRFAQEQSVLAGLNHPNICQLYDALVTDEGWPCIVMELIDGETIVDYCEKNNIGLRDRVRLLVDVVAAVAYAHSQLVVHRDIKPANVLVSENGQVKLLDFGIAKLLESDSGLTKAAPMTPRYASPEQLLGQPVTVASDIAQLGLLIYEVLTGDPLNPSETLASAIQRAADGRSLRVELERGKDLPREVLPIIEQCLRADPSDRYANAGNLKADLEAYLNDYPVSAVGQSAGYRMRKFLVRNLSTAVTAGVALVAIVAGVSWYTWQLALARAEAEAQAAEARLEAERANQVSQFLITLFDAPDPENARGADVSVRQVLEAGIDKIRNDLEGQERLQADLLMTLGSVFNELGEFDKGGPLLEEAVEIHRKRPSPDSTAYATALYTQAQYLSFTGELESAAATSKEALEIARKTPTNESLVLQTKLLNSLAIVLSRLNRFEDSEAHYQEAIAIRTRIYGADHLETSEPFANYALLLMKMGRFEEAFPLLESAYEIAVQELGPYHPWIAPRAINLSRTYKELGRIEEAEELLRVALDQDRHVYGEAHHYVASSLQNLGILIFEEKDRSEGIKLLEQGLAIEEESLGGEHIDTNQTRYQLAGFYTEVGRHDEAGRLLDQAESVLEDVLEGDHIYLTELGRFRGKHLLAVDRLELAAAELAASAAMIERLLGVDSERLPAVLLPLAEALAASGRNDDAVATFSRGVRLLEVAGEASAEHYARLEELKKAAGGYSAPPN